MRGRRRDTGVGREERLDQMLEHREDIDDIQAGLLRTLASAHRLRIIHRLGVGPCGVSELARDLGLNQAAASQHLAVMRTAGIVDAVRDGRAIRYELSDREILAACSAMRSVLVRRLSRLGDLAAAAGAPSTQSVNANEGGSR